MQFVLQYDDHFDYTSDSDTIEESPYSALPLLSILDNVDEATTADMENPPPILIPIHRLTDTPATIISTIDIREWI